MNLLKDTKITKTETVNSLSSETVKSLSPISTTFEKNGLLFQNSRVVKVILSGPGDVETIKNTLERINFFLKELNKIQAQGFINKSNIPLLDEFITKLNLNKGLKPDYEINDFTPEFYR
jgi:alpha-D-ribose 1-methylphosphonate 5-triphosphate synthase subunit PhnI